MTITVSQLAASSGLLRAAGLTTQATGTGTQLASSDPAKSAFGMDADSYFKLFLAELQNQDPTNPMNSSDMVAQMAQFTMIQTMQSLNTTLSASQLSEASSLIGKHVTGTDVNGVKVDGAVDSVQRSGSNLYLVVGTQYMKQDGVATVTPEPAPAAAATPAATDPTTPASGSTPPAGGNSTDTGSGTPSA